MLIGGNTVRVDRPTLDCRFTGDKAPDIIIYSQQKDFDTTIPLFNVDGRSVSIADNLEFLESPSFILVEGGGAMMTALEGKIDWLLQYQTPTLSRHASSYGCSAKLSFLHQQQKGVDLMLWSQLV